MPIDMYFVLRIESFYSFRDLFDYLIQTPEKMTIVFYK